MGKKKTVKYAGEQYRPAPNGRGFDCRATVGGIRRYSRQPCEASARAWLESGASSRPPLTRAQTADAQEALAILPFGTTLIALAAAHVKASAFPAVTTREAVELFIAVRSQLVKRVTLCGYSHILARLCGSAPEMLKDVTDSDIKALLQGHGAVRRNSILTHVKAFLSWCAAERLIASSPAARIGKVRAPEPPKGVLTVAESAALLRTAEEKDASLIPYLSLGLFAGVRPAELQRITATAIRGSYIALTGADTKTADARTIAIRPNLAAWLAAYPFTGKVTRLSQRRHLRAVSDIRKAAGIPRWPHDCMRHSFATYAYEQSKDASSVAAELGHQGTDVFFRHYRALANPGDGKAFFSIYPKNWERIGNGVKKHQQKRNQQRVIHGINGSHD